MKKLTYNIVIKLCKLIFPSIQVQIYLNPFFKLVTRLIRTQGLIKTTKYLKTCRLHCTRYICGSPLLVNDLKIGIDPSGWPKSLLFLKDLVTGSLEERKFLMTLLTLSRTFKLSSKEQKNLKPDYESITKPGKVSKIIPTGFIKEFVKRYNLKCSHPIFDEKNIYLSNKAGPFGKATLTALDSLLNYSYPLMQAIFNITDIKGSDYFSKSYSFAWNKDLGKENKGLGKLAFIYDPECKLRIVAIVDYYTQLFLKPIHEKIFKKLENLPQDRTFTQDPFNIWKDDGNRFWSLDLSSATDRYPITLQRRLLEQMFNDRLAKSWEYILSTREFKTPEGNFLKYSVGQPMGAYSSWASFTITHHLVVQWCAKLEGFNNFSDYILLGDDIVIKNDKVAKRYKEWTNYLGVSISEHKTHVSFDTYEFAKRWISKGKEITGLPLNGIIENINNPFIVMVNLFDFFKVKQNYLGSMKNLSEILFSLYKGLNRELGKKFNNSKFKTKVRVFHESLNFSFGYSTNDSLREILCYNITNDYYVIPNNNLIHQIYDDVISLGLGKSIENSMNNLNTISSKIIDKKDLLKLDDINEIRNYPIFKGILNHIDRYKDTVKSWDNDIKTFRQKSKDLMMLNIDSLFNKERNKTLELLNTGKIFNLGFKKLNQMDEIMYGSAIVESTYSYTKDLFPLIQNNYGIKLNELEKLEQGTYVAEVKKTEADVMDAWAKFFS
ncbi:RNA-dependent RNA polymerases [Alternaria brassicicola mitovirus]|uniref:RNA-dependent RNA polymerases n=1 Tax=Alternaria brassicicola mitovirus TaxID=1676469 RepID=A0ABM5U406_9VIRU|nr:RNA-dependent RNA polymerases [Alternaria brassicicola mitovirus]AKN79252.1 RNA-dependent RNA polymerases [Alternaria brassicicola mitovirus]